MSRLYGSLRGSARTDATRRGSAASGVTAHVRGWDAGVKVDASVDPASDAEVFAVSLTGGSNDGRHPVDVATIEHGPGGTVRVSVLVQDGGRSVYYVDPDGTTHSMPLTPCIYCDGKRHDKRSSHFDTSPVGMDTTSSASRQHYVDTGTYLREGEAITA